MKKIPLGISGRHIHLSKEHLEVLFGKNYELTKFRDLSQPGQFACEEKVDVLSPAGRELNGVRILGPTRVETQLEISRSDAIRGKFEAPVRSSGNIKGSGSATIIGPKGKVELKEGVIVADRHIHFSEEDAKEFNVKGGDVVSIYVQAEKSGILEDVLCRVSNKFKLDCHLDTDDGAAFGLKNGDTVQLVKEYKILR